MESPYRTKVEHNPTDPNGSSMPHAIPFPCPLAQFREYAIKALVPFFIDAATSDQQALHAARQALEGYEARAPIEIQFAAQIVATTLATLACLRTAMAALNLRLDQRLALQDAALELEKQSTAARKVFDACQQQKVPVTVVTWDDTLFQAVLGTALHHLQTANAVFNANSPRKAAMVAAPPEPATPPAIDRPKLVFVTAEPMTAAVLAKRNASPRKTRRSTRLDA
jgi:hypothetical protein